MSITSTLKDYRPPPKVDTKSTGRYATTIYKCQVCTKAFASMAFLEEHMKLHADKTSEPSKNTEDNIEVECTSCNKILPNKEALRNHFMVRIFESEQSEATPYHSILRKKSRILNFRA